ncbi:MAG: hypothetical protein ACI9CU_002573 [Polaribacter sp.]
MVTVQVPNNTLSKFLPQELKIKTVKARIENKIVRFM